MFLRPFLLALQFLTRIPAPVWFEPRPEEWGWSVFYFPIVGLAIGLLLVALNAVLSGADPGVAAALLLAVWALTTGGLHLDGLADAADAWIGGFGDREKTLDIMRDPRSGPIAVMVMTLTLIAKFAALQALLTQGAVVAALWLSPVLGRSAIVLMLITTPYVRPQGVGVAHALYLPRRAGIILLLVVFAVTLAVLREGAVVLAVLLGLGFLGLRRLLRARLGGTTGDTLGATCELAETVTLLALALT